MLRLSSFTIAMLLLGALCLLGLVLLVYGSIANAALPANGPWQIARHLLYG